MHYAWVAASVEICLRKQVLSYKHHEAVAPLSPGEQGLFQDPPVIRRQLFLENLRRHRGELLGTGTEIFGDTKIDERRNIRKSRSCRTTDFSSSRPRTRFSLFMAGNSIPYWALTLRP
jgi:hypothetical protein